MRLNVALIPYGDNDSWVEDALQRAKQLASEIDECPEYAAVRGHSQYLTKVLQVIFEKSSVNSAYTLELWSAPVTHRITCRPRATSSGITVYRRTGLQGPI